MKKMLVWICKFSFALALLTLYGCSKNEPPPSPPPARVETAQVTAQAVPIYIEAIGNALESSIVQIRPQVQGILLKAYVKEGQYVKKGDLLFEIDKRLYQATLDQAKATLVKDQAALEIANDTLKRNEELVKKDYISKLSYDQYVANVKGAQAQIDIDKAQIDTAQINLDFCQIGSPINGKVSFFNVYPGNLVVVNDSNMLIEIRTISPIKINFTLSQRDFQRLQTYQTGEHSSFEVSLPNDPTHKFSGDINFVDNHVDLQSGTIILRGTIQNEEKILWPGEFVTVRIFLTTASNALVVPFSAIQIGQQAAYVYVVQPDMTVKSVNVDVGERSDSLVMVNSGLKLGDQVVTNGQLNLQNGSKVQIAKASTE